jgi:hypothetical protein
LYNLLNPTSRQRLTLAYISHLSRLVGGGYSAVLLQYFQGNSGRAVVADFGRAGPITKKVFGGAQEIVFFIEEGNA